jgi:hypothetical protein
MARPSLDLTDLERIETRQRPDLALRPGRREDLANAIALNAVSFLARVFALTVIAMATLGFGMVVTNVGCNTAPQSIAPEHLRGRIVSFFTGTRFGLDALGGLVAGLVAERLGAPWTLAGEGVLLGVGIVALLTGRRRLVDSLKG